MLSIWRNSALAVALIVGVAFVGGDNLLHAQNKELAAKYADPALDAAAFSGGLSHLSLSTLELTAQTIQDQVEAAHVEMLAGNRNNYDTIRDRLAEVVSMLGRAGGETKAYDLYLSRTAGSLEDTDWSGLGEQALNWGKSPEGGLKWAKNIVFFLLILFVFRVLSRIGGSLVRRTLQVSKLSITDLLRDFFVGTTQKIIFFVGLIVALPMIGVDVGPFLAGIGVAGFVIGFALQDTLSNFAAGVMILLYRPYDVGNVVSAGGVTA